MREAAGGRFVLVLKAYGRAAVSHYIGNVAGMLGAEVSRKLMAHGQRHLFKMSLITAPASTAQQEFRI